MVLSFSGKLILIIHANLFRERGAILVDNLKIANIDEIYSSSNEETALVAEFKKCINAYLKELVDSPVHSLADLIAFNKENSELVSMINLGCLDYVMFYIYI